MRQYRQKDDIERLLDIDGYKFPRRKKQDTGWDVIRTILLIAFAVGVSLYFLQWAADKAFANIPEFSLLFQYM